MTRRTVTQAATAVALDWDIFAADDFDVKQISLAFGTAITTAEALTVTLDSAAGAGSDRVLLTVPAVDMVGATSLVINDINGCVNGDVITVAFTNTDTSSITGSATVELVDRVVKDQPYATDAEISYYINTVRQNKVRVRNGDARRLTSNALTFVNDTTPVVVFTVTGDVIVSVIPICKTNLTSAGACNAEFGTTASVAALIAATDVTTIDAGEIWHDNASDSPIEALSVAKDYIISAGTDLTLTLSGQIDAGAITFYCYWKPLSTDGNVVAA